MRRRDVAQEMMSRALAPASDSGVDVVHLESRAANVSAKALCEFIGVRVGVNQPRARSRERRGDTILMSSELR